LEIKGNQLHVAEFLQFIEVGGIFTLVSYLTGGMMERWNNGMVQLNNVTKFLNFSTGRVV